jgi:putative oxygen-independent coproporphyrinogen III oxidase
VHVPWCVRKCPYCDFNSHPLRGAALPERAYLEALTADLALEAERAAGRPVGSVFLGGGTPSLLSPEAVATILTAARGALALEPGAEVTLEANPGTVDRSRLAAFRAAGVNRLSLGVQSFDDALLARVGRIHTGAEARAAVAAARAAGFANLNLDLMYGLPGQTAAQALADVEAAIALGPEHLSHYQLTLEPGTPFHRDPPALPGEAAVAEIERGCRERLAAAGLERYEVSAFARPGRRCRHNLNYWTFGDYLGIGPGAHGKLTRRVTDVADVRPPADTRPATGPRARACGTCPDHVPAGSSAAVVSADRSAGPHPEPLSDRGERRSPPVAPVAIRRVKRRHPADYLRAAPDNAFCAEAWTLGEADLATEFLLNALRLVEGVPAALFQARTGLDPERIAPALARARVRGLLTWDPKRLQATPLGLEFLDDLVESLAPPRPPP